jgi:galactokinase
MDQAASVLGRAGHAVLLDCGTLAHELVPLPGDHALVIVDSGVRRQLETSGYATRSQELAAALPVLGGRRPADVAPDELPDLVADLDPVPARRLRHVVSENQRVREVVAASVRATSIGSVPCSLPGHASLRDDYEVSTPELDTLVELSVAAGATAARMTGGGFGGAIVALVPTERSEEVADVVLTGYADRHPDRRAAVHVCRAAEGAREVAGTAP